jgi:hypothetical protein
MSATRSVMKRETRPEVGMEGPRTPDVADRQRVRHLQPSRRNVQLALL